MDALGFYTMLMRSLRFRETCVDGVEVGVNQLLISKPELAKRCNLTVAKVRRMLREFQEVGGIRCENIRNKYTLITFLDDFLYTNKGDTGGKSNPPAAAVQTDEHYDIIENAPGNSEDEKPVNPTKNKRGELKAYGKFSNIFLSDDEYSAHRHIERGLLTQTPDKRIYLYERGSQGDILANVVGTYMWVSNMPESVLRAGNLMMRSCPSRKIVNRDILIYRRGHIFSNDEKTFLECIKKRIDTLERKEG